MLDYIKPEHHEMMTKEITRAENFFKHANRDHDATLDFNPEMTELMIFDVCSQYKKLVCEEPPLFVVYRVWFTANHPDVFILAEDFKEALKISGPAMVEMGRARFLSTMLPFATHIGDYPRA